MALNITKTEVINITDDNGQEITKGTPIMLRIKNEDIVCRFVGIKSGYFVTETLDGAHENKYRTGSIESCVRISGIRSFHEPELVEVAADVARDIVSEAE